MTKSFYLKQSLIDIDCKDKKASSLNADEAKCKTLALSINVPLCKKTYFETYTPKEDLNQLDQRFCYPHYKFLHPYYPNCVK